MESAALILNEKNQTSLLCSNLILGPWCFSFSILGDTAHKAFVFAPLYLCIKTTLESKWWIYQFLWVWWVFFLEGRKERINFEGWYRLKCFFFLFYRRKLLNYIFISFNRRMELFVSAAFYKSCEDEGSTRYICLALLWARRARSFAMSPVAMNVERNCRFVLSQSFV